MNIFCYTYPSAISHVGHQRLVWGFGLLGTPCISLNNAKQQWNISAHIFSNLTTNIIFVHVNKSRRKKKTMIHFG